MVRHGESEWNKKNLFCGWFDSELSPKGNISCPIEKQLIFIIQNTLFFFYYIFVYLPLNKISCVHALI